MFTRPNFCGEDVGERPSFPLLKLPQENNIPAEMGMGNLFRYHHVFDKCVDLIEEEF